MNKISIWAKKATPSSFRLSSRTSLQCGISYKISSSRGGSGCQKLTQNLASQLLPANSCRMNKKYYKNEMPIGHGSSMVAVPERLTMHIFWGPFNFSCFKKEVFSSSRGAYWDLSKMGFSLTSLAEGLLTGSGSIIDWKRTEIIRNKIVEIEIISTLRNLNFLLFWKIMATKLF